MQEAGSVTGVVAAAELPVVVEVEEVVEVVDFGFAVFEPESIEHAASSVPVASRAINGVRRRRRRSSARVYGAAVERTGSTVADQAGWRVRTSSTTSSNEVTRSTSRSEWKSYGSTSTGRTPAARAPSTSAPGVSPTWMARVAGT